MNSRLPLTIVALAGALLGATVAAHAQSTPANPPPNAPANAPAPGRHHHRSLIDASLAGLTLSDAQRSQVSAAEAKYHAARTTQTPETRKQLVADVEAALSPDQKTQFESNLRAIRRARRAQAAPMPAPSPATT